MAANIVVADVVVTLDTRDVEALGLGKIISFPSIAFGHASLQLYPNTGSTIGVPMPAIGKFGMKKALTRMIIQGDPALGYYYVYDTVRHTVRIYQSAADPGAPSIAAATAGTPAGTIADTPAGTVDPGTHVFTGTPGTPAFTGAELPTHTHALTGATGVAAALVELPNGTVVPVTTLRLTVIGA